MKPIRTFLALAALSAAMVATSVGNTKTIEEKTPCTTLHPLTNRSMNSELALYVDDDGNCYAQLISKGLPVRGFIQKDQYKDFLAALEKGAEWQKKSKDNELEISKPIKSFMTTRDSFSEVGISLLFSSKDKGKETLVVMNIVDFDNQFSKGVIFLDPEQLAALIENVKKLPAAYELLKKEKQRADDILD